MKKLQLLLTDPCTENWDEMQPSKIGRYCDVCTKHIVDLTTKTDAELIDFFSNKKDNVCGRLLSSQLNRHITIPPKPANWKWMVPFAIGMSLVAPSKAQLKPVVIEQDQNPSKSRSDFKTISVKSSAIDVVKGKVIDAVTKKPLVGVKIKRDGFANVIATTDKEGRFILKIGERYPIDGLVFDYLGYTLATQKIASNMLVEMQQNTTMMLGAVIAIPTSTAPLYIISSGKKSCSASEKEWKKIQPEWIEKMEVVKDASATAIYGIRGANGVVKVEIKKEYANKINFSKKK